MQENNPPCRSEGWAQSTLPSPRFINPHLVYNSTLKSPGELGFHSARCWANLPGQILPKQLTSMKTEVRVQSPAAERTEEPKEASASLEQRDLHGSRVNFFQGNN